ncbi:MAG: hypothetical protein UW54_C0004G0013 [Parcubacteria group bacterium GW2011_GWC1_44_26]|nr:MAG: hypothetical protein UW54_C0004G0013 [Parcubacteria group bacterium GW2011_GWC1_44_26]
MGGGFTHIDKPNSVSNTISDIQRWSFIWECDYSHPRAAPLSSTYFAHKLMTKQFITHYYFLCIILLMYKIGAGRRALPATLLQAPLLVLGSVRTFLQTSLLMFSNHLIWVQQLYHLLQKKAIEKKPCVTRFFLLLKASWFTFYGVASVSTRAFQDF